MPVTPDTLARIALAAGAEIMRVYNTDFSVETKHDKSVLTEADGLAEALILARYQMNTQVYYHRVRRIYDYYLCRYFFAANEIEETFERMEGAGLLA